MSGKQCIDPDQMPRFAAFDIGYHCLLTSGCLNDTVRKNIGRLSSADLAKMSIIVFTKKQTIELQWLEHFWDHGIIF